MDMSEMKAKYMTEELKMYLDMDVDDLLAKLTPEEAAQLNAFVDPVGF